MRLPKWADRANYPEAPGKPRLTLDQWRWESLRRTREYCADWADIADKPSRKLAPVVEMYDRYGIHPAQNPAISKLSRFVVLRPVFPRMYGNSRGASQHQLRLMPSEVAFVYDVSAPHAEQVARTIAVLREQQQKYERRYPARELTKRERRDLVQRHRWPLLLQVVDGIHQLGNERGALKEIAERLRLCDPKQTSVVRDHYRWGVTMWKWLPYPKEGAKT